MRQVLSEVREWLQKAYSDLLSARILIAHSPPVVETAAFHCQQAAEKVLKAFLVHRQVAFERVHNLVYLLDLCELQEADFAVLRESAENLTPLAVEIRYPGAVLGISLSEGRLALADAEAIWNFVLQYLPEEVYPDSSDYGAACA